MEETTLLKLDKVEIRRDENVILHEASFTLHNGEFVYVIGKVGSGKSSLLKSLYCEIPINQGEAWLLDYNLCKMKRKDIPYLRRKLGIVFQDFQHPEYHQCHSNTFVPGISVLDMLFNRGIEDSRRIFWENVKRGHEFDETGG